MQEEQDNFIEDTESTAGSYPHSSSRKQRPLSELKKIALDLSPFERIKPLTTLTPTNVHNTLKQYFEQKIKHKEIPTITGIAMQLNLTRQQLLTLEQDDPSIKQAIQLAVQVVVEYAERLLLSGRPPVGLIFWLKNNDFWVDRTETVIKDKTMAEILEELQQKRVLNAQQPVLDGKIVPNTSTTPVTLFEAPNLDSLIQSPHYDDAK